MTLADAATATVRPGKIVAPRWENNVEDLIAVGRPGVPLTVELKLDDTGNYGKPSFELLRDQLPLARDRYHVHTRGNVVQLTLEHTKMEDAGRYALVAKNIAGESSRVIRFNVEDTKGDDDGDLPTFVRRLSDLAVKVGTRTRFLVEIRSSTHLKVTWHRNDEPLQEGTRFTFVHEGNFHCVDVAPVTVDDQGHWTCMAENPSGRSSCTSHLNVVVPKAYKKPEFVEELRALLTEMGTVSLECKVVGVPTPVLRWFKDDKEIKAGDVFALTANPNDPTSLGTYTCEAVNCMGVTYSSSKVHVVGKGSREGSLRPADNLTPSGPLPVFKKILRDESSKIGDSLTLSCQVQVPPWPKSIVWYNKEGRVEGSEKYHIMEDGLGGYSIEIKPLEAMDEGEWKCVATSNENVKQFTTCHVMMSIPKNYRKPRFMESLRAVLTEEGLVSFECKVVGFPTPALRWFKDGQELKPGDVYQLTGTNSLGSYCCIARNCMGETKSTAELTVEDIQNQLNEEERLQLFSTNQPPKFIKGLKSCEAKINEDFRFTIQVSIVPEPGLSWYRDDEPVKDNERYLFSRETLGTCHFDIRKLEFSDQAEWKCVATNDFGHSITSCFLKLLIPKHFKTPKFLESLRAILSEEGAVNLECKVIGVPQPILKWYKDGVELKPGDIHRIISGQDGTCCLGTYTCEATNCMGTVSSSASLLGFEDRGAAKKDAKEIPAGHDLARNLSLSTIHEERTSQMYDTPQTDQSMTLDERGEVSFSFDGKEVSVSLYETPDLTEEEALQIVEMYADQLSEHVTEHNVIELPPLRFVKETSNSGNLLMEAVVIDVSPDYFITAEEDLRTEADMDDMSIMEDQTQPLSSPEIHGDDVNQFDRAMTATPLIGEDGRPLRPPRKKSGSMSSRSERSERSERSAKSQRLESESYHSAREPTGQVSTKDDSDPFTDALSIHSQVVSSSDRTGQKEALKRKSNSKHSSGEQTSSYEGDSPLDAATSAPKKKKAKKKKEKSLSRKGSKEESAKGGESSDRADLKTESIAAAGAQDESNPDVEIQDLATVEKSSESDGQKSLSKGNKERLIENIHRLTQPVRIIRNALVNLDTLFEADSESQLNATIMEHIVRPIQELCEEVSLVEEKALKSAGDKSLTQAVRISLLESVSGPMEELLRGIELIKRQEGSQAVKSDIIILESLTDPIDEISSGLAKIEHELSGQTNCEKPIALQRIIQTTSRLGKSTAILQDRVRGTSGITAHLKRIHDTLDLFIKSVTVSPVDGTTENIDTIVVESLTRPVEELERIVRLIASNPEISLESESGVDLAVSVNELKNRLTTLSAALESYGGEATGYHSITVMALAEAATGLDRELSRLEKDKTVHGENKDVQIVARSVLELRNTIEAISSLPINPLKHSRSLLIEMQKSLAQVLENAVLQSGKRKLTDTNNSFIVQNLAEPVDGLNNQLRKLESAVELQTSDLNHLLESLEFLNQTVTLCQKNLLDTGDARNPNISALDDVKDPLDQIIDRLQQDAVAKIQDSGVSLAIEKMRTAIANVLAAAENCTTNEDKTLVLESLKSPLIEIQSNLDTIKSICIGKIGDLFVVDLIHNFYQPVVELSGLTTCHDNEALGKLAEIKERVRNSVKSINNSAKLEGRQNSVEIKAILPLIENLETAVTRVETVKKTVRHLKELTDEISLVKNIFGKISPGLPLASGATDKLTVSLSNVVRIAKIVRNEAVFSALDIPMGEIENFVDNVFANVNLVNDTLDDDSVATLLSIDKPLHSLYDAMSSIQTDVVDEKINGGAGRALVNAVNDLVQPLEAVQLKSTAMREQLANVTPISHALLEPLRDVKTNLSDVLGEYERVAKKRGRSSSIVNYIEGLNQNLDRIVNSKNDEETVEVFVNLKGPLHALLSSLELQDHGHEELIILKSMEVPLASLREALSSVSAKTKVAQLLQPVLAVLNKIESRVPVVVEEVLNRENKATLDNDSKLKELVAKVKSPLNDICEEMSVIVDEHEKSARSTSPASEIALQVIEIRENISKVINQADQSSDKGTVHVLADLKESLSKLQHILIAKDHNSDESMIIENIANPISKLKIVVQEVLQREDVEEVNSLSGLLEELEEQIPLIARVDPAKLEKGSLDSLSIEEPQTLADQILDPLIDIQSKISTALDEVEKVDNPTVQSSELASCLVELRQFVSSAAHTATTLKTEETVNALSDLREPLLDLQVALNLDHAPEEMVLIKNITPQIRELKHVVETVIKSEPATGAALVEPVLHVIEDIQAQVPDIIKKLEIKKKSKKEKVAQVSEPKPQVLGANISGLLSGVHFALSSALEEQEEALNIDNLPSSTIAESVEEVRQVIAALAVATGSVSEPLSDEQTIEELSKLKKPLLQMQRILLIKEHGEQEAAILKHIVQPVEQLKMVVLKVIQSTEAPSVLPVLELLEEIEKDVPLVAKELAKRRKLKKEKAKPVETVEVAKPKRLAGKIAVPFDTIQNTLTTILEEMRRSGAKKSPIAASINVLNQIVTNIAITASYSEPPSDEEMTEILTDLKEPLAKLNEAVSINHKPEDLEILECVKQPIKALHVITLNVMEESESSGLQNLIEVLEEIENQVPLAIKEAVYKKELQQAVESLEPESIAEIKTMQSEVPEKIESVKNVAEDGESKLGELESRVSDTLSIESMPTTKLASAAEGDAQTIVTVDSMRSMPSLASREIQNTSQPESEKLGTEKVAIIEDPSNAGSGDSFNQIVKMESQQTAGSTLAKIVCEPLHKVQLEIANTLDDFEQLTEIDAPPSELGCRLEELRQTVSTLHVSTAPYGKALSNAEVLNALENLFQPLLNLRDTLSTKKHNNEELLILNHLEQPIREIGEVMKQVASENAAEGFLDFAKIIQVLDEIQMWIPLVAKEINTRQQVMQVLSDISRPLDIMHRCMVDLEATAKDAVETDVAAFLGEPINTLKETINVVMKDLELLEQQKCAIWELKTLVEPLIEFQSSLSMIQSSQNVVPETMLLAEKKNVILQAVNGLKASINATIDKIEHQENSNLIVEPLQALNQAMTTVQQQVNKTDYYRRPSVTLRGHMIGPLDHLSNTISALEDYIDQGTYDVISQSLETLQKQILSAQDQFNQIDQPIDEEVIIEGFLYPTNQLQSALTILRDNLVKKAMLPITCGSTELLQALSGSIGELRRSLTLLQTELTHESKGASIIETLSAIFIPLDKISEIIDKIVRDSPKIEKSLTVEELPKREPSPVSQELRKALQIALQAEEVKERGEKEKERESAVVGELKESGDNVAAILVPETESATSIQVLNKPLQDLQKSIIAIQEAGPSATSEDSDNLRNAEEQIKELQKSISSVCGSITSTNEGEGSAEDSLIDKLLSPLSEFENSLATIQHKIESEEIVSPVECQIKSLAIAELIEPVKELQKSITIVHNQSLERSEKIKEGEVDDLEQVAQLVDKLQASLVVLSGKNIESQKAEEKEIEKNVSQQGILSVNQSHAIEQESVVLQGNQEASEPDLEVVRTSPEANKKKVKISEPDETKLGKTNDNVNDIQQTTAQPLEELIEAIVVSQAQGAESTTDFEDLSIVSELGERLERLKTSIATSENVEFIAEPLQELKNSIAVIRDQLVLAENSEISEGQQLLMSIAQPLVEIQTSIAAIQGETPTEVDQVSELKVITNRLEELRTKIATNDEKIANEETSALLPEQIQLPENLAIPLQEPSQATDVAQVIATPEIHSANSEKIQEQAHQEISKLLEPIGKLQKAVSKACEFSAKAVQPEITEGQKPELLRAVIEPLIQLQEVIATIVENEESVRELTSPLAELASNIALVREKVVTEEGVKFAVLKALEIPLEQIQTAIVLVAGTVEKTGKSEIPRLETIMELVEPIKTLKESIALIQDQSLDAEAKALETESQILAQATQSEEPKATEKVHEHPVVVEKKADDVPTETEQVAKEFETDLNVLEEIAAPLRELQKSLAVITEVKIIGEDTVDLPQAAGANLLNILAEPFDALAKSVAVVRQQIALDAGSDVIPSPEHVSIQQTLNEPINVLQNCIANIQENVIINSQATESEDKINLLAKEIAQPLANLQKSIATVQEQFHNEAATEALIKIEDISVLKILAEPLQELQKCLAVVSQQTLIEPSSNAVIESISSHVEKAEDCSFIQEPSKNEPEKSDAIVEELIPMETTEDKISRDNVSLITTLTHPLEELQKTLIGIENRIPSESEATSHSEVTDLSLLQAIAKPLEELKQSILVVQENTAIEGVEDIPEQDDAAKLIALAEPLAELCESIAAVQEEIAVQTDRKSPSESILALPSIANPLEKIEKFITLVEQQVAMQPDIETTSEIDGSSALKTLATPIQEIRRSVAVIQEHVVSEPEATTTLDQDNLSVLKTLADPLQEIQNSFALIEEQVILEADVISMSEKEDIELLKTLASPLEELQRSIAVIQDHTLIESAEQALSEKADISLLKTLAEPIIELQKSVAAIQEHVLIEPGTTSISEREDTSLLKAIASPIEELQKSIAVIYEQTTVEPGVDSISETEDLSLLKTLAHPLEELQKCIAVIQEHNVVEPKEMDVAELEDEVIENIVEPIRGIQNMIMDIEQVTVDCDDDTLTEFNALQSLVDPLQGISDCVAAIKESDSSALEADQELLTILAESIDSLDKTIEEIEPDTISDENKLLKPIAEDLIRIKQSLTIVKENFPQFGALCELEAPLNALEESMRMVREIAVSDSELVKVELDDEPLVADWSIVNKLVDHVEGVMKSISKVEGQIATEKSLERVIEIEALQTLIGPLEGIQKSFATIQEQASEMQPVDEEAAIEAIVDSLYDLEKSISILQTQAVDRPVSQPLYGGPDALVLHGLVLPLEELKKSITTVQESATTYLENLEEPLRTLELAMKVVEETMPSETTEQEKKEITGKKMKKSRSIEELDIQSPAKITVEDDSHKLSQDEAEIMTEEEKLEHDKPAELKRAKKIEEKDLDGVKEAEKLEPEAQKKSVEKEAIKEEKADKKVKDEAEQVKAETTEKERISLETEKADVQQKKEKNRSKIEEDEREKLAEQESLAKEEVDRRQKEESERLKKEEAEKQKIAEQERLAKEEADRKKKEESERLKKEEAEKQKIAEQERLAKEEAERKKKEESERLQKEEAEKQKIAEQERLAKEEADRKKKEESERLKKEEAEKQKIAEQERLAKEEADRKEKEESERLKKEEAEKQKIAEQERLAKEEAERKKKEESERLKKEEAEKQKIAEQERLAKEEAEKKKKEESERLKKEEAEKQKIAEQERLAKEEAERKKKEESERLQKEEAEKQKIAEQERLAKEEADRKKKEESERLQKEEAEKQKIAEQERLAKEEADRKKKEESERLQKEEAEKQKIAEQERLAKEEAERKKKEESERLKKEEAEKQKIAEQERLAKEEADRKKKEESERLKKEEAEKQKIAEQERLAKEEADRKKKEESERLQKEEAEKQKIAEQERLAKEEAERKKKEESERLKKEEAEKQKIAEQERLAKEEADRKKKEESERLKKEEAEKQKIAEQERLAKEEAERKKKEESERLKKEEAEKQKIAEQERLAKEEADRKKKEESERLKKEEAEKQKIAEQERLAKEEAEKKKKEESERLKKEEAEKQKIAEQERLAKEEAEKKKKEESERLKKEEAEKQKIAEQERLAKEEAERKKKEESERLKKEEAEKQKIAEQERLAKEEAEKKKKEESERLKKEEAEKQKIAEQERLAKEEAEKKKKEESERLKKEEAEKQKIAEQERLAKEEAERKKKEESERLKKEEAEKQKIAEQERLAKEEAERKKKEESERLKKEEAEKQKIAEQERLAKEEAERKKKEESERLQKEEAEKQKIAEQERLAKEEADRKKKEESERLQKEEAEKQKIAEQERLAKEEADIKKKQKADKLKKEKDLKQKEASERLKKEETENEKLAEQKRLGKREADQRQKAEADQLEKERAEKQRVAEEESQKIETEERERPVKVEAEKKIIEEEKLKALPQEKETSDKERDELKEKERLMKEKEDKKRSEREREEKELLEKEEAEKRHRQELELLEKREAEKKRDEEARRLKKEARKKKKIAEAEAEAELLKKENESKQRKEKQKAQESEELEVISSTEKDDTASKKEEQNEERRSGRKRDKKQVEEGERSSRKGLNVKDKEAEYFAQGSEDSDSLRDEVTPAIHRKRGKDQAVIEVERGEGMSRRSRSYDVQTPTIHEDSSESLSLAPSSRRTRSKSYLTDDGGESTAYYSASSRTAEANITECGPRDFRNKPSFCTKLTDRTAAEGSRIKLTCAVLGSPEPKIIWSKDGRILADSNRYRTKLENGMASLEFYAALPEDSGDYSCMARNTHGQSVTEAKLKVYAGFETSPVPPTFTRSMRDTFRFTDNELILECRVRGQPLPTISWFKDNQPLLGERYRQSDLSDGVCRLQISSPNASDSGEYTCRAENNVWTDQISHMVKFDGRESYAASRKDRISQDENINREPRRPHFASVLTDHSVPAGGTIALQVEVKGTPAPEVLWLHGETRRPVTHSRARTFAESGVYTLMVPEASHSETGTYICRASNAYGSVDTVASVEVVAPSSVKGGKPAMFLSRPDSLMTVALGEDVTVSFRVTGTPKPRVTWMKGIRDITNSLRSHKESIDDYVRFTQKRTLASDEGTYCILAKNCYGCDRTFFTVRVKQRARSLTPSPDWGSLDTSSLLADINDEQRSYPRHVPGRIGSEPIVIDSGRNWLTLSWGKAEQRGPAPVCAYRVDAWQVGGAGGARWFELGVTPLNTFDAFNLRPGSEYRFRVTPRNRYGWGEPTVSSGSHVVGEIVELPEFTRILPGQLKALENSTVSLECEVRGDSRIRVLWYRDSTEIDPSEESRYKIYYNGFKCSLTIFNITATDSGRYVCEATNKVGRVSTFARVLVVGDQKILDADAKLKSHLDGSQDERPPQFTMRLRDRRVQMTYPVRLTCQVIGDPTPLVTWYKNGKEIQQDGSHIFWNDESHFHTLEVTHSNLEDSGCYMAAARNSAGSVSCRCILVVDKGIRAYIAPEFLCGLDAAYTAKVGGELRMSAQVEAYPSVGVVWHRDGIRLRPSRRAVMTLNHDGTVELSLANVTPRDAGIYSCTATNEVGRTETTAKVSVIGNLEGRRPSESVPRVVAPDIPYSKEPLFVTKPLSTDAVEGDTVIILCEVVGDPKPDVMWLRDFLRPDYYRDAPHFRRVGEGPQYRLEIPYAKLDFTGTYTVIAKNCHGEAKAIISLQIYAKGQGKEDSMDQASVKHGKVVTLPIVKRELKDLRCCDGDAVSLECKVHATPAPDIRWEKDGRLLPLGGDFASFFDGETARLSIQHIYPEDEGEYTCVAYNDLGKAFTSACLVVDGERNQIVGLTFFH
ncbi:titin homolog isoform X2 [Athalia rosae]|uniref:titin homolog isoform X2 n=1 Tax=Athalia rosae TaxID=37344 RepID=UPI0020346275|nr:titin homolog isoform X2 [Athalia rosae]